jgi:hypothetical protein
VNVIPGEYDLIVAPNLVQISVGLDCSINPPGPYFFAGLPILIGCTPNSVPNTAVIFAANSVWLKEGAEVLSGDVHVNAAGLSIGQGVNIGSGSAVAANRIKIKSGATVLGQLGFNELVNNGTATGPQVTPIDLPLLLQFPDFQTATPGTTDVTVSQGQTAVLAPGAYGNITLKKGATLVFSGGSYDIGSINSGLQAVLAFQAPSVVRVQGKFDTDQRTYVGPQGGAPLTAADIVFFIGGMNGRSGALGASPKAAQLGVDNEVHANFYVPNGTLWIREGTVATGAFHGRDVIVGIGVRVALDSSLLLDH